MNQTARFPTLEGFDPLSPEFLRDPNPIVRRAQKEATVFYYEPLRMWVITRHEDICAAARDVETFSSKALGLVPPPPDLAPRMPERMAEMFFIAIDPPIHTNTRMALAPFFTPRRFAKLEEPIRAASNRLIDRFIDKGEAELMYDFCYPLSLEIIVEFLGIPKDRFDDYRQWTDDTFSVFTPKSKYAADVTKPMSEGERRERWTRLIECNDYFSGLLDERAANPQDDLISAMLQVKDKEGNPAIPRAQILRHIQELVAAGNDTTANLIAAMVQLLNDNPHQLALLKAKPDLMANAVEEALRIRGTSPGLFRITTRDVEIGGASIPEGSSVWLLFAAGGIDEDKFADAIRFDIQRPDAKEHLAFGHGRHSCLGNPLARLEIKVAMEELLRRIPNMKVVPGQTLTYLPTMTVLCLKNLKVTWDRQDTYA